MNDTSSQAPRELRALSRELAKVSGLLSPDLLGSGLTLCEARCLFELGQTEGISVSALATTLELDLGYVSRITSHLCSGGFLSKIPDAQDRRAKNLILTEQGRRCLDSLEETTDDRLGQWLSSRPKEGAQKLLQAIRLTLAPAGAEITIRDYRPGDFGQIIKRHADIYTQEFDYPPGFEGYVVLAVAKFIGALGANPNRLFVAERAGEFLGSAAIQVTRPGKAQLRFVLVESAARGLGLGRRLVEYCIEYAKNIGTQSIMLETASNLLPAHRLYHSLGFKLTSRVAADFLPEGVLSETWELPVQAQ
jgi:DNA-binding MarR family transcriptional regulator/N-acetylglutamate synthase-like GNAT family acetyltransferase